MGATPWLGVRWSGRSAVEVVGRRQEPCTGMKRKVFKRTVIRPDHVVLMPRHELRRLLLAMTDCRVDVIAAVKSPDKIISGA